MLPRMNLTNGNIINVVKCKHHVVKRDGHILVQNEIGYNAKRKHLIIMNEYRILMKNISAGHHYIYP